MVVGPSLHSIVAILATKMVSPVPLIPVDYGKFVQSILTILGTRAAAYGNESNSGRRPTEAQISVFWAQAEENFGQSARH
jgi:hypothetical protein